MFSGLTRVSCRGLRADSPGGEGALLCDYKFGESTCFCVSLAERDLEVFRRVKWEGRAQKKQQENPE